MRHDWHESGNLREIDLLWSDKTDTPTENITTTARKQQSSRYAPLTTEWTPNAHDATDMMLFKCQQEVQADLDRHTSLDYTPFDPAMKATESCVQA